MCKFSDVSNVYNFITDRAYTFGGQVGGGCYIIADNVDINADGKTYLVSEDELFRDFILYGEHGECYHIPNTMTSITDSENKDTIESSPIQIASNSDGTLICPKEWEEWWE